MICCFSELPVHLLLKQVREKIANKKKKQFLRKTLFLKWLQHNNNIL